MLNHGAVFVVLTLLLTACSADPQQHSQEPNQKPSQKKGTIVISNDSAYLLSDIEVRYSSAKRVDALGDLPAHTSYSYDIHYTDTEDSIHIHYIDHEQQPHSITVVPYAAKYDKQRYTINLN